MHTAPVGCGSRFQSTLPRGERHAPAGWRWREPWFQSTLPRGERLTVFEMVNCMCDVSIHAPARGATFYLVFNGEMFCVSIHAPARGATTDVGRALLNTSQFQSTLPRGERHGKRLVLDRWKAFQSTLPRGERPNRPYVSTHRYRFNPRSREGSDIARPTVADFKAAFQSTLPRGERPEGVATPKRYRAVSIHAPARGATEALSYL